MATLNRRSSTGRESTTIRTTPPILPRSHSKTMTTGRHIDKRTTRMLLIPAALWEAVAPAARLPVEILEYIFLLCARRDYHGSWGNTGVPPWVKVSYVCSRWRYVALSCPTLWSYLFIASPCWTDELLIRSKVVPLWVRVYFTRTNRRLALDFMEQVTPHAERFRECRLDIPFEDTELVLPMLSSRSAPLLETLEITSRRLPFWNHLDVNAQVDFGVDEDAEGEGPHIFFNGDTPALRELHLNDYLITWCSPTLGGLTVLQLRDLHYSVRPTIAELSVMLSRMPYLAELYLDNAIRGGPDDPIRLDAEKIPLPRLAHLLIAAPFSKIVRFLSCIDIPVTTRVRLSCRLESHSDGNDYAPFYALLSERFSNSENEASSVAPIRTLFMDSMLRHVSIVFSKSERRCGRPRCNSSIFNDCDCDVPLKVAIECPPHATEDWSNLAVGICRSVPLACLKNLILNRGRLPTTFWLDIVWYLQELRYIELNGGDFSDVLFQLSLSPRPLPKDMDKPADQRTNQLFAPSLEELCLDGVWVARNIRCGGNPSMHGSHVMLFLDALVRRRAAGHALKRLFIKGDTSFSRKEVIRLREMVPQVGVEGFEDLPSGDEYPSCEDCMEGASEEWDIDELSDGESLYN